MLKAGKGDDVQYEPICVFTENKPKKAFWRGAKRIILYVDGAVKALRFAKATDELQIAWTKKEADEFVKKEIAKAHQELKVMRMWQFGFIMVFLIVILLIELSRMGVTVHF